MELTPPDIVLLGPEWPERARLRAQLIKRGRRRHRYRCLADPETESATRHEAVMVVDLHELPDPRETLDELCFVIPPHRVLVVTALGTLTADEIRRLGFMAIKRPARRQGAPRRRATERSGALGDLLDYRAELSQPRGRLLTCTRSETQSEATDAKAGPYRRKPTAEPSAAAT
jgi:hypothetical protein